MSRHVVPFNLCRVLSLPESRLEARLGRMFPYGTLGNIYRQSKSWQGNGKGCDSVDTDILEFKRKRRPSYFTRSSLSYDQIEKTKLLKIQGDYLFSRAAIEDSLLTAVRKTN